MTAWWYWALVAVAAGLLLAAALAWGNARYQETRRRERAAYRARYGRREWTPRDGSTR